MRRALGWLAIGGLLLAGCGEKPANVSQTPNPAVAPSGAPAAGGTTVEPAPAAASGENPESATPAAVTAAPIESGAATLSPENTTIEFVGTHAGGQPNPRIGGFEKFTGKAEVDADGKTLQSVSVEIDTTSLWTQFGDLTNHLNSPDFFDTREYPAAKFESTQIVPDEDGGKHTITGNLMLLETTKEISFPAIVVISGEGLSLQASFTIDRAEFGMDKLQDRVEKPVTLTVAIGKKTAPQKTPGGLGGGAFGGGGGRGPGGKGGGKSFDPVAFFKQRDANGDGKLTGDEISERMREDLEAIDTDGDGEVSQEEFQARMRQIGGGKGKGPGGAGAKGQPAALETENKAE